MPAKMTHLLDCFIQTAHALQSLHAGGFIHCDLKPANILRSITGETKVIDLGQACVIGARKPRIQGTPDFIAPEQVKCEPLSPRTDVFNFGATLYWSLAARNCRRCSRWARTKTAFWLTTKSNPRASSTRAFPKRFQTW